jgi:hypothetical protein
MANYTELEKLTLDSLIDGLYAEAGFSDVDANDLAEWTGIPTKTIRGTLASLVKKGTVWIEGNDSGYQIIYLSISAWGLHPRWKDSDEYAEWLDSQSVTA